jgi:aminotransferase
VTKFNIQPAQRMQELPKQFFASLVAKVTEKVNQGYDVINLGQGNPDQPTPDHIVAALQEASANPTYHKYSPFQGFHFLKEAIAKYYHREYNVDIDPDTEVAILFGGKSGLIEVSQCLLNPGDLCLVPDPGYPDYLSGISLARAQKEFMPLLQENEFLPDYSQLTESSLKQAKMMFLNYPNNPTAAVATDDFFTKTVNLAYDHQIAVIHDFAYGAIGFDGQKPISFLQTHGAKEIGIEVYTMSKTYNMAGWRVGFALGNPDIIRLINQLQDHQFVSLFGGIQAASAFALTESQDCVRQLVQLYEKRRDHLYNELDKLSWQAEKPKGSFFSWLPVPKGYTSTSFSDLLLEEAQIVVAPGVGFGQYGDPYVRVGLLTSEERFSEAIRRIKKLNLF